MWTLIILSFGSYVNTVVPVEFMNKEACIEAKQKVDEASKKESLLPVRAICVPQGESD